jgi:phosphatidylglycerophosphatase A
MLSLRLLAKRMSPRVCKSQNRRSEILVTLTTTSPEIQPPNLARHSSIAWLPATFFGVGYLRPGPGTWASAITVLLWWIAGNYLPNNVLVQSTCATAALVTLIGIPLSSIVERESGIADPGFVVIDEVAGQLITVILAPVRWQYALAGFILFRCFDIFKPPPLRRLERLPAGYGIMLDDVGAGVYAWIVLQTVRYLIS